MKREFVYDTECNLSTSITVHVSNSLDNFQSYYKSNYSGRTLEWQHSLGHCKLKANFKVVSIYFSLIECVYVFVCLFVCSELKRTSCFILSSPCSTFVQLYQHNHIPKNQ